MANEEQLSILKQGVEVWNKWRTENPEIEIDLFKADLEGLDLNAVNLNKAILVEANLQRSTLSNAHLIDAQLMMANFTMGDLNNAELIEANLSGANLELSDLTGADLTQVDLGGVNLRGATLSRIQLKGTQMGSTILVSTDLSTALGIEDVIHEAPSPIGIETITNSKGRIPEIFLRGCGLSDADIEYAKLSNPENSNEEINKILYKIYELKATQPLQISPLFISYSNKDISFIEKLEFHLNKKGIRSWRDVRDAVAGRLEKQIDRAIRQNPTVLLVLSKNSLSSDWVEHEVRMAREIEKEMKRDVLCPIALDDSWKSGPWPKRVMEQIMEYNILDFSAWEDDVKFEGIFRKLIDGLELFYKG